MCAVANKVFIQIRMSFSEDFAKEELEIPLATQQDLVNLTISHNKHTITLWL